MKKSEFYFSDPVLLKADFKVNENYEFSKINKMDTDFEVKTNRKDETHAVIALCATIGNKNLINNIPFYCEIEYEAKFNWEESLDDDIVNAILSKNAPALLLSYIRPIISIITSSSPFPKFDLPFYNFNE